MSKSKSAIDAVGQYALGEDSTSFDKMLPSKPIQSISKPTRITYKNQSGKTKIIQLQKNNKYNRAIFNCCYYGFNTSWFGGLGHNTQSTYFDHFWFLFDWINRNNYSPTSESRYNTLQDHESYLLNDRERISSPLYTINNVLREGLGNPMLKSSEHEYIHTLISVSKPTPHEVRNSISLSTWLNVPWLRREMTESEYLQLESPKLLMNSFRVTTATTLHYLLNQREQWQKFAAIDFEPLTGLWQHQWNRLMISKHGNFDELGEPRDQFTDLLWLDLVTASSSSTLKQRIIKYGTAKIPRRVGSPTRVTPWQNPFFFHPNYQTRYSPLEELLCSWLLACEGIQPTDIPKLKLSNYAREYNRSGRLIAMECTYYKGRSGTHKQPAILSGSDIWTKVLEQYMQGLTTPELFKTGITDGANFVIKSPKNTSLLLLLKLWKLPSLKQQIDTQLKSISSSPLFLNAIYGLENGGEAYAHFQRRTGKSSDIYKKVIPNPLPTRLFTQTHIKNSAIHAGSDTYRESDLVNHHSHTSLTEKTHYLTDQNKEWVNQAGRITRLVFHDLQNIVFNPSISSIQQSIKDLELRTRVVAATSSDDSVVNSLRGHTLERDLAGDIIVSDTISTAIYFIHFLAQAETHLSKLLATRPDWVERNLIAQVEWMTITLSRMRSSAGAQKEYKKLAAHLPPLFDHLFETTE